jgi:hypothetical protein
MRKEIKIALYFILLSTLIIAVFYYFKSSIFGPKEKSNQVSQENQISGTSEEGSLNFLTFIEKFNRKDPPQKYLFLFQNSMELRPTGGFIGSFAIVDIAGGKIIKKETFDTAVFDKNIKDSPEPPYFIKKYLHASSWGMRDSNWSFDFPTSATRAISFYEMGSQTGEKLDGVIGFTTNVLSYLIGKTGSVEIQGIAGEFTEENCLEKLEYEVEMGYNARGVSQEERKNILGELMEIVLARMMQLNKLEQFMMLDELKNLLNKKDIQFFFLDPQMENFVLENNWGGEIVPTKENDYLSIVDSNLGARKTDRCMERSFTYYIDADEKERAQANLKINYKNTCLEKNFMTDNYHSYLRIYTPQGTQIESTEGFDRGYIDESMLAEENVAIEEEKEKTIFGNLVYVPLGQEKNYSFTYKIPESVNLSDYKVYFQKQAGMKNPYLKIILKHNQKEEILFEGEIEQDILIP